MTQETKKESYFGNKSLVVTILATFLIGPFSLFICCFPIDERDVEVQQCNCPEIQEKV